LFKKVNQEKISVKDLLKAGVDISNKPKIQEANPITASAKNVNKGRNEIESKAAPKQKLPV